MLRTGKHDAAGIVNTVGKTGTMLMENCANYGAVHSDRTYGYASGLLSNIVSGQLEQ